MKLKYTNDTSAVVLVTLTDDITYGEFVAMLNICMMDEHKRFAAFDDKFVIYGESPPVKIKEQSFLFFNCGFIPVEKPSLKLSNIERLNIYIKKDSVKTGIVLLTGWFYLVIMFIYFQHKKKSYLFNPFHQLFNFYKKSCTHWPYGHAHVIFA